MKERGGRKEAAVPEPEAVVALGTGGINDVIVQIFNVSKSKNLNSD